jgi:glycosyltransferase involved in cell wall biosynthesis
MGMGRGGELGSEGEERDYRMTGVKLSVCMPTYNGELFLAEAVQSVLRQSFSDFELLLVDDCSQDSTWEIVSALSDPRVKIYRNQQCLGIPGNWNRCLALAQGEYLCLFHQDDLMLPDNLAQKVHMLETNPTVGIVHSAVDVIAEDSAPRPLGRWTEETGQDAVINGRHYFRKLLFWGNQVCAPAVVCRRHALLEIGGFNEQLHFACDYEAWLRMCVRSDVGFLPQQLVRYRWHGNNATHRFWFENGVEETATAIRNALLDYARCTGQHDEVALLQEATAALTTVRLWLAHAEKGREGWESGCRNLERVAAQLRVDLATLQAHVTWLEDSKAALATDKHTLAQRAEALAREVQTLQADKQSAEGWAKTAAQLRLDLTTLQVHVAWLENSKAALTMDNRTLEQGAEALEREVQTLQADKQSAEDRAQALEGDKQSAEDRTQALKRELQLLQAETERQKQLLGDLQGWLTAVQQTRLIRLLRKLRVWPSPPVVTM